MDEIKRHQFDPRLPVTIVDVTPNVPPMILKWNPPGPVGVQTFEPDFETYGDPLYKNVPRKYAERLLANNGGRTMHLVAPSTLIVPLPNGRGGITYAELRAWVKTATGEWREKTEDEVLKEGKPVTNVSAADLNPKPIGSQSIPRRARSAPAIAKDKE